MGGGKGVGSKIWGWMYQEHKWKQIKREKGQMYVMKGSGGDDNW
jgi:hypothetical protein